MQPTIHEAREEDHRRALLWADFEVEPPEKGATTGGDVVQVHEHLVRDRVWVWVRDRVWVRVWVRGRVRVWVRGRVRVWVWVRVWVRDRVW